MVRCSSAGHDFGKLIFIVIDAILNSIHKVQSGLKSIAYSVFGLYVPIGACTVLNTSNNRLRYVHAYLHIGFFARVSRHHSRTQQFQRKPYIFFDLHPPLNMCVRFGRE